MNEGPELSDAVQQKLREVTPNVFLYERARQIQEVILPQIAEQRASLDAAEQAFKAEMAVLEAASKVLPPDRIALNPESTGAPETADNIVEFNAGGVN